MECLCWVVDLLSLWIGWKRVSFTMWMYTCRITLRTSFSIIWKNLRRKCQSLYGPFATSHTALITKRATGKTLPLILTWICFRIVLQTRIRPCTFMPEYQLKALSIGRNWVTRVIASSSIWRQLLSTISHERFTLTALYLWLLTTKKSNSVQRAIWWMTMICLRRNLRTVKKKMLSSLTSHT